MKKRSIIELTPLLDVILILIFAFLINMQGQSDSMNEKYDAQEAQNAELEAQVQSLKVELSELKQQSENLKEENDTLLDEVDSLKNELGYEVISNDEEKETLKKAMQAFTDLTGINNDELKEILENDPSAQQALSKIVDSEDIVLEMYKYNYVMNRFFFIDMEIVGKENRIVINGEETQIAISFADSENDDTKREKSLKIYDELKEIIDNRPGGDEMVMVTIIVRDPEVYQYAYEIAWESLRELELRASGYRMYKTSYTYTD